MARKPHHSNEYGGARKGAGPPTKSGDGVKAVSLSMRVHPDTKAHLQAMAAAAGVTVTDANEALINAAKEIPK